MPDYARMGNLILNCCLSQHKMPYFFVTMGKINKNIQIINLFQAVHRRGNKMAEPGPYPPPPQQQPPPGQYPPAQQQYPPPGQQQYPPPAYTGMHRTISPTGPTAIPATSSAMIVFPSIITATTMWHHYCQNSQRSSKTS